MAAKLYHFIKHIIRESPHLLPPVTTKLVPHHYYSTGMFV